MVLFTEKELLVMRDALYSLSHTEYEKAQDAQSPDELRKAELHRMNGTAAYMLAEKLKPLTTLEGR